MDFRNMSVAARSLVPYGGTDSDSDWTRLAVELMASFAFGSTESKCGWWDGMTSTGRRRKQGYIDQQRSRRTRKVSRTATSNLLDQR